MPSTQFRQVGVPDARRVATEVRRHLRHVQRRTGALLNRQRLPRPKTLLRTLDSLEEAIGKAYDRLQLRRIAMLREQLIQLSLAVQQNVGLDPEHQDTTQTLRQIYRDSSVLLHELQSPRRRKTEETEQQYQAFLHAASARGWRVPESKPTTQPEADGVEQSCRYIQRVGIAPDKLLNPADQYGLVSCALLLLNDPPIPESTLVRWTREPYNLDVYVVFGHYIVLPRAKVLGVHPDLAVYTGGEGIEAVNINRFAWAAEAVNNGVTRYDLIRYPQRVQHHYYCPMLGMDPQDRRYFRKWAVLINEGSENGNAENQYG